YLKAAENIVRFEEWYSDSSENWAIQTLDQGLERAKQAEGGKAPWRDSPGKGVVRAYGTDLDGSIQPFAVLLPHDYGKDPKKKWRLDIVLHGRDSALTEAKFIATHGTTTRAAPKDLDYVQLEVYGRGNNAYRWAGEQDVFDALKWFMREQRDKETPAIDLEKLILRGFSMGGAGTWHLGLHHPFSFTAIGPGAGFTTTHGYVGGLPKELPDYQEKCLRIYDAVDYAENAFNVPVVAYSGANDPQKAAADNIEKALKGFKEPLRFTHLIAPRLEHQMPKEWQDKAEVEFKKYLVQGRKYPEHVRFVTYTTRYNDYGHGWIDSLEHQYEKAVIDSRWTKDELKITTENIAVIRLYPDDHPIPATIEIDGQRVQVKLREDRLYVLEKTNGKWAVADTAVWAKQLRKRGAVFSWLQGPIDDAFTTQFKVVAPSGEGWYPTTTKYLTASRERFAYEWDKYFRGMLQTYREEMIEKRPIENLVLFGDPENNPLIAKVLPKLPITWTKEKLVVNDVEYDPKTHIPVLIYPNPLNPTRYVVLNSGHTFKEVDFKGSNALLYPRLGDWAVLKPTPTPKDPAAYEVVAAGLFDENWQFPKARGK
ncbi:MAG TPA: hypothetical protein VG122_15860, partial [Gemmata sp.]|nr:hypothetical protein [Gemmata sp.]